MKRWLVLCCLVLATTANSQSNLVKGTKYIGLKYGFSKYSFPTFGQFEWGWSFKEKMILRTGCFYEYGNVGSTVFNIPGVNIDYGLNLFGVKNKVYTTMFLGAHTGIEMLHSDRNDLLYERSLVVGGKVSVEVDFILSQKFSLKYEFTEWYSHYTKLGNWYFTNTLGVIYVIN